MKKRIFTLLGALSMFLLPVSYEVVVCTSDPPRILNSSKTYNLLFVYKYVSLQGELVWETFIHEMFSSPDTGENNPLHLIFSWLWPLAAIVYLAVLLAVILVIRKKNLEFSLQGKQYSINPTEITLFSSLILFLIKGVLIILSRSPSNLGPCDREEHQITPIISILLVLVDYFMYDKQFNRRR